MAGSVVPESKQVLMSRFKVDLSQEARRFVRQRAKVVVTGVVLGLAFMVVGVIEVGALAPHGASVTYAIALLLIILGAGVAFVSLNSGLINPVTAISGNAAGITFTRRWGGSRIWDWHDPTLRLDIDDRSVDPTADDSARSLLFFEGPGTIYGNLNPTAIPPLLDTARTYGAAVSSKQLEQAERGGIHLIRRIRVRPAAAGALQSTRR